VPGYDGYLVSRTGQVLSLKRNKLLAQARCKRGYSHVTLSSGGRARNHLVHRLVASAYIGPIPEGYQVNHLDSDRRNNNLRNLEICTPEANMAHAQRHGRMRRGEANPRAKLTEAQVRAIRRARAEGATVRELARRYDAVSEVAIRLICARKTWKHLE
jgi:hypothetical protein